MIRKIDFADDLLPLLEAEAKRLKTTLSGLINMRLSEKAEPASGPDTARIEPVHGPDTAPIRPREGDIGGGSLGRGKDSSKGNIPEQESFLSPPVDTPPRAKRGRSPGPPPDPPPPEIAEAVRVWLTYKRERGESYKPAGLQALYAKLLQWGPERAMAAVEQSMANNWAGVFEPRNGHASPVVVSEPDRPDGWAIAILDKYPPGEQRDAALATAKSPADIAAANRWDEQRRAH